MLAIGIAFAPAPPWIFQGARDLQGLLGFLVIRLELVEADRPVAAVTERRLALEPFGPPAKRDHRVVDRASPDSAAGVVGAKLDRIGAAGNPLVGPEQTPLIAFIRGEVVERSPERSGIERHYGEAGFRELARKRPAAGTRSYDCEIDLVIVIIAAHRGPFAGPEDIRGLTVSRSGLGDFKHRR